MLRIYHPGVVRILDTGVHAGEMYVVLPFAGRPYYEVAPELSLRQHADVVTQIASALDEIAKHGITHRDVKPANIMIDESGGARLIDFGIAKTKTSALTTAGQLMGTPGLMSPEQWKESILADPQADQWSLAASLFDVLTGDTPKIDTGVVDTSALKKHVTPEIFAVVDRALSFSPAARYNSSTDFASSLRVAMGLHKEFAGQVRETPNQNQIQTESRSPFLLPFVALLAVLFAGALMIGMGALSDKSSQPTEIQAGSSAKSVEAPAPPQVQSPTMLAFRLKTKPAVSKEDYRITVNGKAYLRSQPLPTFPAGTYLVINVETEKRKGEITATLSEEGQSFEVPLKKKRSPRIRRKRPKQEEDFDINDLTWEAGDKKMSGGTL